MRRLLVALLFIALPACSTHQRHTAVVADTALYEVLNSVHQAEQQALCGQPSCANAAVAPTVVGWTQERSTKFNRSLLPAVEAGREFNQVLSTWNPDQPAPPQLHSLTVSLLEATNNITSDFPDGPVKSSILSNLARAQNMILSFLDIVLSMKGA